MRFSASLLFPSAVKAPAQCSSRWTLAWPCRAVVESLSVSLGVSLSLREGWLLGLADGCCGSESAEMRWQRQRAAPSEILVIEDVEGSRGRGFEATGDDGEANWKGAVAVGV